MCVLITLTFGWVFYLENGLRLFIACVFFLGFFGGNFALFSLWFPEQYDTSVHATAFSFATSFGRFVGAGVNFLIGAMVRHVGTIGKPVAYNGYRLRAWAADHSVRAENPERTVAGLKGI
jgi:hypothetical protein